MKKNILAENMRRFATKNLPEQTAISKKGELLTTYDSMLEDYKRMIEQAKTDSELEPVIAEWASTFGTPEEFEAAIAQLSQTPAPWLQKVADFFKRNQTDAQLRSKQIRQATRNYRAQQAMDMTFGRIAQIFQKHFRN